MNDGSIENTSIKLFDAAWTEILADWQARRVKCVEAGFDREGRHWGRLIAEAEALKHRAYSSIRSTERFAKAVQQYQSGVNEAGVLRELIELVRDLLPMAMAL